MPSANDLPELEELWRQSNAAVYEFSLEQFCEILNEVGKSKNYGQLVGEIASPAQRLAFFARLRLSDLVLARACALGSEPAWEQFMALYRQPLERTALAITRNEMLGRDLAQSLWADVYALKKTDGMGQSILNSYKGTGSLRGWLCTVLAKSVVDHHRRSYRETPLDGRDFPVSELKSEPSPDQLAVLSKAIKDAICQLSSEDRFLLAAHYVDEKTLREMGKVLNVDASTVSRQLRRMADFLRKGVLRNLQESGLSRLGAEEALGTDPRDLTVNLKEILQKSWTKAFPEKDGK